MELAGEVAALGPGAERFARGERVMAIVGGGAQAELCVVHERQLMPVPDALGGPPPVGCPRCLRPPTTRSSLRRELRPGERLLVHGGAGGVGTAAIQLARASGARVTATVRREESRAEVAALGAEAIAPEGFAEQGPFDVILELVGAPNMADNLNALATGGRIAVIGVSAGVKCELNLLALMGKRARIHGSTLRARPLEEKALAPAAGARSAAAVRLGRPRRADRRDLPARRCRRGLRPLRSRRQARQDHPRYLIDQAACGLVRAAHALPAHRRMRRWEASWQDQ